MSDESSQSMLRRVVHEREECDRKVKAAVNALVCECLAMHAMLPDRVRDALTVLLKEAENATR